MKSSKKLLVAGIAACTLGLAGLVGPSVYFWYQNRQLQQVAAQTGGETITVPTVVEAPKVITGKPVRVMVPSIGINVAVTDGVYNPKTGEWSLSWDKAHYALMTVQPNDKQGNTLIYGHLMRNGTIFGKLRNVRLGAEAKVMTSNGYIFTYKFKSSQVIEPTDTSILRYEGAPQLTLQTCTGAFAQDRQLFDFDFVSVKKNS